MSILARMPRDRFRRLFAGCLAAAVPLAAVPLPAVARAEQEVIGVVACDGYADLRKQLAWFGMQVGNPTLVILAESMLTGITGGRGLAGLDVKRPFGVIITADGDAVSGSAFLPVTDVDKLLGSLEGVVGPAEADGDDRRITPPAGGAVRIVTKNGWAILSPEKMPKSGVDDPSTWIPPLADDFTLAARLFPSRMPLSIRERIAKGIEAASTRSAQLGQPVDAATVVAAVGSLGDVESMTIGLKIDDAKNRVLLEMQSTALPGSAAAKAAADLSGSPLTVPLPKSATKPMARGFVAQRIPPEAAKQLAGLIDASAAVDSSDPISNLLAGVVRSVAKAAVGSGRLDGSMSLVNAAAEGEPPAIEFTGGMHVKDGAAVEQSLRKLLGDGGELPPIVKVKFDDGRVGDAKLHSVAVDLSKSEAAAMLGDTLTATVAVAPEACYLLVGGDAKARLAELSSTGPPAPASRPLAAVQVSADQCLSLAAGIAKKDGSREAAPLAAAAEAAAGAESAIVQLQVRAIERGVAWQASVDSGVLKAAAASAGLAGGAGGGLPFGPGGPLGGALK